MVKHRSLQVPVSVHPLEIPEWKRRKRVFEDGVEDTDQNQELPDDNDDGNDEDEEKLDSIICGSTTQKGRGEFTYTRLRKRNC